MVLPELIAYLVAEGLGTAATNLFYAVEPPSPDDTLTLYEYGGLANEPEMGTPGTRLEFPSIQARARGVDYNATRLRLQNVVSSFTKVGTDSSRIALSGVNYKAILAIQPPQYLMQDVLFRYIFVCNFRVTKEFSAT